MKRVGKGILVLTAILAIALVCGASGCKKGQTFEQWQQKVENLTGNDSIESQTLRECVEGIRSKEAECSKNEGWAVDILFLITEFKTNKTYQIDSIKQGGKCKPPFKKDDPRPFTVDSKTLDTMSERKASSFQIFCKIGCYSWPCKAPEPTEATKYPSEGYWQGKFNWYFPDECYRDAEAQGYGSGYLMGAYEKTRSGPKLTNFRLTPSMPYTNPNNGNPLVEGQKYEWDGAVGSTKYHFEGTLQGTNFSGEIPLYERCSSASPSNNYQKARFSMGVVSY